MKILIPGLSGFCPGVRKAEEKLMTLRKSNFQRKICIPGYLINNKKYIEHLSSLRIQTLKKGEDIPTGALVGIRTHGMSRYEEEKIRKNHEIVDLTCRNVKKVQNIIEHYSRNDYCILITGKKNHPEVIGLESYAKVSYIIENTADADYFLQNARDIFNFPQKINKLLLISQTTGSRELFVETQEKVKAEWQQGVTIRCIDSICPVTDKKEEQALELQLRCDVSFVIGDPLSSNARKLYQRLLAASENVHFIEDAEMLKALSLPLSRYASALVVSSASTPVFIEDEVIAFLKSI
ncbi:MAG: 4-hydroxy-3-methylbut-2-enyl diphosphate reductase [Spirochaetales bacterium]|nr:4-hydroxy-3-methylbut-2-enyl diphosphate reductase [Spirochaetales bacterium]